MVTCPCISLGQQCCFSCRRYQFPMFKQNDCHLRLKSTSVAYNILSLPKNLKLIWRSVARLDKYFDIKFVRIVPQIVSKLVSYIIYLHVIFYCMYTRLHWFRSKILEKPFCVALRSHWPRRSIYIYIYIYIYNIYIYI